MLDDLLIGDGGLVPYGREAAYPRAHGPLRQRPAVNGTEHWRLTARPGEAVRLYLTNAANARTFNVSVDGARLRVIAG